MGRRTSDGTYTPDDIVVLSSAKAIRSRPKLYLGDMSKPEVLHKYFVGSLCWGLDEIAAEKASVLEITLSKDGLLTLKVDGPGMPTHLHTSGRPVCEVVMTALLGCRSLKETDEAAKLCSEGSSMAVVNAFSSTCKLRIHRAGSLWEMQFREGQMVSELTKLEASPFHGTSIELRPDPTLFQGQGLSAAMLRPIIDDVSDRFPCGTIWLQEATRRGSEPVTTFDWS